MRDGVVWIATIALASVAGFPLAFARPFGWLSFPARVALGAGAGWFATTLVMTILSLCRIPWNPWWVLALACLASAAFARGLGGEKPIPIHSSETRSPARAIGLLLAAAAVAVAVLAIVSGSATSVDLLLFWGPKGQEFGAARGIDVAFLRDPNLDYLHASYPPLVTSLYAQATMAAGRFSWLGATATFPLVLAALAAALPSVLRLSTTPSRASVATAVVVCGIALVGTEADVAGSAEMPLLFFETLAMAILIAPTARAPSLQILAGVLLGGAASTKVEGLPFVISAVALFLLLRKPERRWPVLARLAIPTLASLGLWFLLGATSGLFRGYQGYGQPLELHPGALGIVLASVAHSLWLIGYALPFAAAAALLLARERGWRPAWLPLGTAMLLGAFLVFTYLHVADPALWISWSAARIFSPLVPLLALGAIAPEAR